MTIFDSHAHYDDKAFDTDRRELLSRLPGKGVSGVINCGCTVKSSLMSIRLAEEYDYIYAAVGIHGLDIDSANPADVEQIDALCTHEKVVAIGEIGLDYHYRPESADEQKRYLRAQLELAAKHDLPVILHDREAHADTLALLHEYRPRGVMHCFSGSAEMAKEVLQLGLYIGLGGACTFKNARKPLEVAAIVPADRLLLETDCPYMTPVPFRGQRNDSSLILHTAAVLARVRNTDAEALLRQTDRNAQELFFKTDP